VYVCVRICFAVRETEVLSLTRQLDQSHREAEMYKLELATVRKAMGCAVVAVCGAGGRGLGV
jgi:hypothetical protein